MALNVVTEVDGSVAIRHVLISVSDKTGLDMLVRGLLQINPDIHLYSTGGTYAAIQALPGAERNLIAVSDYTGQPEMQGGLVKTLDFKIYLGLLSETYNEAHQADLARTGAVALDMVVVNLYPFREAVARADVTPEMARTNIDIGGPCMIRAAAKNYLRVASVTDPSDYEGVLGAMAQGNGHLDLAMRLALMKKAFAHTAAYDAAIGAYFGNVDAQAAGACYRIQ